VAAKEEAKRDVPPAVIKDEDKQADKLKDVKGDTKGVDATSLEPESNDVPAGGEAAAVETAPMTEPETPSKVTGPVADTPDTAIPNGHHLATGSISPVGKAAEEPATSQNGAQEDKGAVSVTNSASGEATPIVASAVPLPESQTNTPVPTRPVTPVAERQSPEPSTDAIEPDAAHAPSATLDRAALSPLSTTKDLGLQSLSVNSETLQTSSASQAEKSRPLSPQPKSPVAWTTEQSIPISTAVSGSRFGGKGWGVLDDPEEDGLFGKGGPSGRSDPWGNMSNGVEGSSMSGAIAGVVINGDGGGWAGEDTMASPFDAGPSRQVGLHVKLRSDYG
jgi:hypothetical protein